MQRARAFWEAAEEKERVTVLVDDDFVSKLDNRFLYLANLVAKVVSLKMKVQLHVYFLGTGDGWVSATMPSLLEAARAGPNVSKISPKWPDRKTTTWPIVLISGNPTYSSDAFKTVPVLRCGAWKSDQEWFPKDTKVTGLPAPPTNQLASSARAKASTARMASHQLIAAGPEGRSKILKTLAKKLIEQKDKILAANKLDMDAAKKANYEYIKRLGLSESKLETVAAGLSTLASAKDPVGTMIEQTELTEGLVLDKCTYPFGVIMVIFESRPDVLVQVAALAIKSGNGVLLKGGKESANSCAVLDAVVSEAITEASNGRVSPGLVGLIAGRDEISELLKLHDLIDLCIPRGSNKLVKYIEDSTNIPVLGHSEGMCHIYVDNEVEMEMAKRILVDAKTDYPAACNAVETILLHQGLYVDGRAEALISALQKADTKVHGCPGTRARLSSLSLPPCDGYRIEYCANAVTVKMVPSMSAATDHIHKYGSGHTESILTSNKETAEQFLASTDSGSVYHNCSTRFADGFRYGFGAEVGISTKKVHARGPVGVEGLETTRFILRSSNPNGHCVADFKTKRCEYTHKKFVG